MQAGGDDVRAELDAAGEGARDGGQVLAHVLELVLFLTLGEPAGQLLADRRVAVLLRQVDLEPHRRLLDDAQLRERRLVVVVDAAVLVGVGDAVVGGVRDDEDARLRDLPFVDRRHEEPTEHVLVRPLHVCLGALNAGRLLRRVLPLGERLDRGLELGE